MALQIHTLVIMNEYEIVPYTSLFRKTLYCAVMLIKVVQGNLPKASLYHCPCDRVFRRVVNCKKAQLHPPSMYCINHRKFSFKPVFRKLLECYSRKHGDGLHRCNSEDESLGGEKMQSNAHFCNSNFLFD